MRRKSNAAFGAPSKKQAEVLAFIQKFTNTNGYSPSLEEIADHFGRSIATIHQHVSYLKEKNLLSAEKGKRRSLISKNVSIGRASLKNVPEYFSLPVLGSANCGSAEIFAEENLRELVSVSSTSLGRRQKDGLFIVEAEGDSMNLAKVGPKKLSIEEGDYVVVDSNITSPSEGDYVLSIIDGCANVKKFRKVEGRLALAPESKNTNHKPIFLGSADDFMVNGKIVAVLKK